MNRCSQLLPLLEPFVDGELSPERMVEVEQHLTTCQRCMERVRLNGALRLSVRQAARDAAPVTEEFSKRVRLALAAERAREDAPASNDPPALLPWRTILPIAAAAAATLVSAAAMNDVKAPNYTEGNTVQAKLTDGVEALIDEFVRYHANPPEQTSPEVAEEVLMHRFQPELGEAVPAPSLIEYGARWEGGAVVPVRNHEQRAALMHYRIGNQRITIYVYDASKYPLRARLEPRVVRDVPVYVGKRQGYSIAAAERRRVGVAVTADLDDVETAELVAAAFP